MEKAEESEKPQYEPPSVEKALQYFETTLSHRIRDPSQVTRSTPPLLT